MRLLWRNSKGDFIVSEPLTSGIPPYAILSHTWGSEEVTFQEILNSTGKDKAGYKKLRFMADQAAKDHLTYFWVDTCCIDKSSSAEHTEAINSMFRWYQHAAKCYVYLADVSTPSSGKRAFRKSRWFTRGWTLQELLAPPSVEFFSADGSQLGNKSSLQRDISRVTGIPVKALQGRPLSKYSVSERMVWAKDRKATRKEDEAYCLLGIFGVHMPLIYGEGANAFVRLRDVIMQRSRRNGANDSDETSGAKGMGRINTRVPTISPTISPTFSPTFSPTIGSRTMGSLFSHVEPPHAHRSKAPVNHDHRSSQDTESDSDSDLSSDSRSDSYSDSDTDSNSDSDSRSDSYSDSEDDGNSSARSMKTHRTPKSIYRAFKKHGGVSLICELVNDLSERFL